MPLTRSHAASASKGPTGAPADDAVRTKEDACLRVTKLIGVDVDSLDPSAIVACATAKLSSLSSSSADSERGATSALGAGAEAVSRVDLMARDLIESIESERSPKQYTFSWAPRRPNRNRYVKRH